MKVHRPFYDIAKGTRLVAVRGKNLQYNGLQTTTPLTEIMTANETIGGRVLHLRCQSRSTAAEFVQIHRSGWQRQAGQDGAANCLQKFRIDCVESKAQRLFQ